ncbi:phosphoesterase [Lewinellaceae bacterium SD302]|nr:phosphoesterase [Lewinellaceae bacterium SD302]
MSQYLKPQTKKLQDKIDHIVVVMLENRSFDNLLGWLYEDGVPNGQEFEGLNWNIWNPLDNIDADGIPFQEKVRIEKNGMTKKKYGRIIPNPVNFCLPDPDPGEGFKDTNDQLFSNYEVAAAYPPEPTMMGFVNNYQKAMLYGAYSFGDDPTNPRAIMKCFTPEQTPVLSGLAQGFAVCDHYHASIPSQTLPNRSFVHAATSDGHVNNRPDITTNARTVFNQIQDAIDKDGRSDLSWMICGDNVMPSGRKGKADAAGAFPGHHFSLTRLCMAQLHDQKFDNNFGTIADFKDRCKTGNLASYTFIEPTYGGPGQNDQHPPADIRPGEQFMADLYNAIRNSPKVNETLFVITYDEHGGCFDHVPPPKATVPVPGQVGQDGFTFNRFGVRVPCVVTNPYIPAGMVARPSGYVPYDHTSIIKTIQTCFSLEGHLTERDKAAPDLSGLLTLDDPRTDLPAIQAPSWDTEIDEDHESDLHRLMLKLTEAVTGKKKPADENLLTFVQEGYNATFRQKKSSGKSKTKSKSSPTLHKA